LLSIGVALIGLRLKQDLHFSLSAAFSSPQLRHFHFFPSLRAGLITLASQVPHFSSESNSSLPHSQCFRLGGIWISLASEDRNAVRGGGIGAAVMAGAIAAVFLGL
jgi:hypothetical protein